MRSTKTFSKSHNLICFLFIIAGFFLAGSSDLFAQCGSCTGGPQNVSWKGWTFQFVRPCLTQSTTAGGRGGGLELRNARYNGRLVFTKAHTPIVSVKYENDGCGPFRDWQYEETPFACSNVTAAGRCDGPATTNCDIPGGGDTGSFCGVSVFRTPSRLTLTTNVSAGWYRYIIRWIFYPDGKFHPEVDFGAVSDPCLTNAHVHLVYHRIDMDIETDSANRIEEHNVITDDGHSASGAAPQDPKHGNYWEIWDPVFTEMARNKQMDGTRWWRVRNTTTNRAYLIYPHETYKEVNLEEVQFVPQVSDFWFLKYNSANQEETNDFGSSQRYWGHLNNFIQDTHGSDDPSLMTDPVVWFSGSVLHGDEAQTGECHTVFGPWFFPDPKGTSW